MSGYDEALETIKYQFAPHDPYDLYAVVDAFLAALPPSIIVDGRVVELEKVLSHAPEHVADTYTGWVLAAAREVANG